MSISRKFSFAKYDSSRPASPELQRGEYFSGSLAVWNVRGGAKAKIGSGYIQNAPLSYPKFITKLPKNQLK